MSIGGNQTKTKQETKNRKVFLDFGDERTGSEPELILLNQHKPTKL